MWTASYTIRFITDRLLTTFLVVALTSHIAAAFNVDSRFAKVFTGTKGSLFGYTLSFDQSAFGAGHINLLIGAPKKQRRLVGKQQDAGSLVTCYDVLDDVKNCKEEPGDNVMASYASESTYIGEGYGTAVSVDQAGTRFICAPYWTDLRYRIQFGYTFMIGRCVLSWQTQGTPEVAHVNPYNSGRNYVRDQEYFTGLAGFGTSSDVYQQGIFVAGSPGLTIFEGGVTIVDFRENEIKLFTTSKDYHNTHGTTAFGYLGYQVKFGRFCNYPLICLAAGAPQLDTVGVVRLYKWVNEQRLINFQTLKGEKTWSYYGSVLCAADTDGDQMDELLVGAPFYTDGSRSLDIGRVYLYKREPISKYFQLLQELDGARTKYSRFGSAIQVIGDINLDTYSDVAIGAPGEEEGSGCIYIYLGSVYGGISLSQRICSKHMPQLHSPLKGFGSSISGSSHSNGSPYPIFAVGAFQSDKTLVFRSRPILEVTSSLTANPNRIDIGEPCKLFQTAGPCTVIVLCLEHRVRRSALPQDSQKSQTFELSLKIDAQSQSEGTKRAAFMLDNGHLVDSIETSKHVKAKGEPCFDFKVVLKTKQLERDRFTPILVEFIYSLQTDRADITSPILDPATENKHYHMITFSNECGSDNICHVDLKAGQRLIYPTDVDEDGPYISLGHTEEITVLVTVSNSRESCYWTRIVVQLSQPLTLNRFNSDTIRQCQPLSGASTARGTTVVCNYYQPLVSGAMIGVTLTFDTDKLSEEKSWLAISTEATSIYDTYNPETNSKDNKIQMTAHVHIVADASIFGTAIPLEMTINKGKKISLDVHKDIQYVSEPKESSSALMNVAMVNHKVLVKNKGPSFLPMTRVNLTVPHYIPDGTRLVTHTVVKLITDGQVTDCSHPVDSPTAHVHFTTTRPPKPTAANQTWVPFLEGDVLLPEGRRTKRKKREAGDEEEKDEALSTTYILSCDVTPEYCLTFTCDLPKVIQPGGHVQLNVTLTLDKENIPVPQDFTSFQLELKTLLEQPTHELFKPWNATGVRQVVTHSVFHLYQSSGEINLWVIIGSVAAGLVLIAIIVVVCWKLGFFKRKRHFQVKTWRRESQKSRRESQKSKS